MRRLIAFISVVMVLVSGVAQRSKSLGGTVAEELPTKPQNATQASPQQQKPPKPGVLTAQADPLGFFARGEGTLIIRGRGYFVINTVQGKVQVEGFREVKELPRGVRIKPPLDKRLKVYMGQGTLRIVGKFDSVRGVMRKAQIEFNGVAAFNMQGTGAVIVDGVKRTLTPITAYTILVPTPDWYKGEQKQETSRKQEQRQPSRK